MKLKKILQVFSKQIAPPPAPAPEALASYAANDVQLTSKLSQGFAKGGMIDAGVISGGSIVMTDGISIQTGFTHGFSKDHLMFFGGPTGGPTGPVLKPLPRKEPKNAKYCPEVEGWDD